MQSDGVGQDTPFAALKAGTGVGLAGATRAGPTDAAALSAGASPTTMSAANGMAQTVPANNLRTEGRGRRAPRLQRTVDRTDPHMLPPPAPRTWRLGR
jgi:hypothetical protein